MKVTYGVGKRLLGKANAGWTLAQVYNFELLVDAAAEGSRAKALVCESMIRGFHEAEKVLDALDAQDRLFYPLRVPPIGSLRLTVRAATRPRA